jgi:hypothetical protein
MLLARSEGVIFIDSDEALFSLGHVWGRNMVPMKKESAGMLMFRLCDNIL